VTLKSGSEITQGYWKWYRSWYLAVSDIGQSTQTVSHAILAKSCKCNTW